MSRRVPAADDDSPREVSISTPPVPELTPESRIVIVGAGPAGLSTAYWLELRGYENVTVLEKAGRVGGLCKSITVDGASFDLGANFVTKAYKNVRALAKKYGAKMHSENPFCVMEAPPDTKEPVVYHSLFDHVRDHSTAPRSSVFAFGYAVLRFVWLRWRLSPIIDRPTFEGVAAHPELCVTFADWLRAQKCRDKDLFFYLQRLFQVPVTMMGYGQLEHTAAPYALKFMTLATFVPVCLKALPYVGKYLTPWPKRFNLGFQRLWERVSWDLNVRTDVKIHRIARPAGQPITITYTTLDQDLNEESGQHGVLVCDAVILACALSPDILDARSGGMLELTEEEHRLFSQIHAFGYCMSTRQITDLGAGVEAALGTSTPLLCVFPENQETLGRPWAVAQANADVDFVQFYSRVDPRPGESFASLRRNVTAACTALLGQMAAAGPKPTKPEAENDTTHTFDLFLYFQHVEATAIREGWYDALGALQGTKGTYYVGGATNFELIEPITEFSKHIVQRHFRGNKIWFPFPRAAVALAVAVAVAVLCAVYLPPDTLYIEVPVSDETPEAQAASAAYWDAFQGQHYDRIPSVLAGLEAAYAKEPDDQIVAMLIGATHLWRYTERRRVGGLAPDYVADLDATMRYSDLTVALASAPDAGESERVFAPAMHAIARWGRGLVAADPRLAEDALVDMLANAIDQPMFDSFVLAWVSGAMLEPTSPRFASATAGLTEMMNACAGFSVPAKLKFTKPVLTFMALEGQLIPERRQCYNNDVAPHNLEGYYMSAGDVLVKAGQFDVALVNYQNAARMPMYDTWPFRDVLASRLTADLPSLQKLFIEQTNLLDIPAGQTAMTFRLGEGCSFCHAR